MADNVVKTEILAQTAQACVRSCAQSDIAAAKRGLDSDKAAVEGTEITQTSAIRVAEQLAVFQAEYDATIQTADVGYQATIQEATWTAFAIYQGDLYRADTIANEANFTAIATAKNADAQQKQIFQSAAIDATTTTSLATIQVSGISGEATIDVSRILAIADLQARMVTTEATKQASGALAVAQVQAHEITTEADIQSSTTTGIASAQSQATAQEAAIRAKETTDVAAIQVLTIQGDAFWEADVTEQTSIERQRGDLGEVAQRASEITTEANIKAQEAIDVATIERGNALYAAGRKQTGDEYGADQDYLGAKVQADDSKTLTLYRADKQSAGSKDQADTGSRVAVLNADNELSYRTVVATTEQTEEKYRADADFLKTKLKQDSISALLQKTLDYVQKKWDDIYPELLKSQNGQIVTPGFLPTPSVSRRTMYTPSVVRMMQNTAIANADARLAGDLRSARQEANGRGFSTVSPFLDGERLRLSVSLAKDVGKAVSDVTLEGAKANAALVLAGQQQQDTIFNAQQKAYVEADANNVKRIVALLDGLAGVISSL